MNLTAHPRLGEVEREWFVSETLDGYTDQSILYTDDIKPTTRVEDYNLVSSIVRGTDLHAPALDIDIPCRYVPSSTPGHGHLYFDSLRLDWYQYRKLLEALADAGIVEPRYVEHSVRRGMTLLRPEHIKKVAR